MACQRDTRLHDTIQFHTKQHQEILNTQNKVRKNTGESFLSTYSASDIVPSAFHAVSN